MKNVSLFMLFFFIGATLSAQQFSVNYSHPVKDMDRSVNLPITGGGFLGIKKEEKRGVGWNKFRTEITFVLFDKNLSVTKEKKLAENEASVSIFYSDFRKIGDKFWLIYIEPAEKTNIGDVKVVEVNPVTLEVSSPKTIVKASEMSLSVSLRGGPSDLNIISNSSADKKKTVLFISTGKEDFFITALNEVLEPIWGKRDILKDVKENDFYSGAIDNEGNCYISYKRTKKGYVSVFKGNEKGQTLAVDLKGSEPKEILLLPLKDNNAIAIVGTYFNDTENIEGVYKATIPTTSLHIEGLMKTPFPETLITQFADDYWANTKAKKYGLEPTFLTHLFEVKEGAINLVIEMKKSVDITRYNMPSGTRNNSHSYTAVTSGNILNVYFANNKPAFTRIPKFNIADGAYWKHFFAFPFREKVIIFYNDNSENLTRDIASKPKQVDIERNSVLVAAVIEPNGSVKRVLPLDIKEDYMGIAEWIQPVSINNLIIPIHGLKKKKAYATISIQ